MSIKRLREELRRITAEPLGNCPCGQEIGVCLEPPSVTHTLPLCSKFQRLGPLEFLRYVRESRGLPDPEEPN